MLEVESILRTHEWPKRNNGNELGIAEIERRIGFKLPDDYRFFLTNYSASELTISEHFFKLWDKDDLLEINSEYGILDNMEATLGIGSNGASELIAIQLRNTEFKVVLTPFIDLSDEYNIVIGTSFTNFLQRLQNGKSWFDA